jgi:serine/threonine protein kinase
MKFEQFQVLEEIGQGGFARVYKCHQKDLNRLVAIKVLEFSPKIDHEQSYARFEIEARALCRLNHPNVVKVYGYGQTSDGKPFLAMEYLNGQTVSAIAQGGLSLEKTKELGIQMLNALEAVHKAGLIHRDLSVSNFIVVKEEPNLDVVKLFDFGLVKDKTAPAREQALTMESEVVGTPAYMSPEQCMGKPLTAKADIYSIGCVLYHLYTGRPPFIAPDSTACLYLHIYKTPSPMFIIKGTDVVCPDFEHTIATALAKDPSNRFATAADFAKALRDSDKTLVASGEQAKAIAPYFNTKTKRNSLMVPLACAAIFALGITGSLTGKLPFDSDQKQESSLTKENSSTTDTSLKLKYHLNEGDRLRRLKQYDKAIASFYKALNAREKQDLESKLACQAGIAMSASNIPGQEETALNFARQILNEAKRKPGGVSQLQALEVLVNIYRARNDNRRARYYCIELMNRAKPDSLTEISDKCHKYFLACVVLGTLDFKLKNYEQSLISLKKAEQTPYADGDSALRLAETYMKIAQPNFGDTQANLVRCRRALPFYLKAEQRYYACNRRYEGFLSSLSHCLKQESECYYMLQENEKALESINKLLALKMPPDCAPWEVVGINHNQNWALNTRQLLLSARK